MCTFIGQVFEHWIGPIGQVFEHVCGKQFKIQYHVPSKHQTDLSEGHYVFIINWTGIWACLWETVQDSVPFTIQTSDRFE